METKPDVMKAPVEQKSSWLDLLRWNNWRKCGNQDHGLSEEYIFHLLRRVRVYVVVNRTTEKLEGFGDI